MQRSRPFRILRLFCLVAALLFIAVNWPYELFPRRAEISGLSRHFSEPLPKSAKLEKGFRRLSGFSDACYAFRFSTTDDALRDQLVEAWSLERVASPREDLPSFVSLDPPRWFPKDIEMLDERYRREDREAERYWCVWIDRQNNGLYAEHGRW